FADAIAEVVGAAQDFDFNAHEVNRQIAAVNLRKPYGILLRRDNHLGLPLLAAVDGIDNFLLAETMVIGKALRVNQFAAEVHQAALEALRLGDAAQCPDFAAFEHFQSGALAGEHVLQIQRVVNALDNAGPGIELGDAPPQLLGLAVALGDE